MRAFIIILSVLLMACLVCSTPINPRRWLINRPTADEMYGRVGRERRASPAVKGGVRPRPVPASVKGGATQPLEHRVRKGEYVCGNKICKLTPGVVPKNCPHGMCQYPI